VLAVEPTSSCAPHKKMVCPAVTLVVLSALEIPKSIKPNAAVEVPVAVHLYQPLPTDVIVAVTPALNVPTVPVPKLNQALVVTPTKTNPIHPKLPVPALKYIEPVYTIPEIVAGDIPRLADDCVPEAVNVDAVVVESGAVVEFPVNVALPMVVQSAGDVLIVCELIIKFCPVPLNTPVCPVIVVAFTVDGVVLPTVVPLIVPPVMATALAFCSANVPTPVSVWLASQAVAPVALKVPSAGVEWLTVIGIRLETVIYKALIGITQ